MPGQPIAWYERIAAEIDAGRMPMPSLTEQSAPKSQNTVYSYAKKDLDPKHRTEVVEKKPSKESKKTKPRREKLQAKKAQTFNHPKQPEINPASKATQEAKRKLIGMCGGDVATASRLAGVSLHGEINDYAIWGIEKAILDLWRDRR